MGTQYVLSYHPIQVPWAATGGVALQRGRFGFLHIGREQSEEEKVEVQVWTEDCAEQGRGSGWSSPQKTNGSDLQLPPSQRFSCFLEQLLYCKGLFLRARLLC